VIGTFQALVVALVAVLPGAVYAIARENLGASWAWRRTDTATQIFRFLGASAVFHVVFAPLTYVAYQKLVVTRALTEGRRISLWWWLALLAYVLVPYLSGAFSELSRVWGDNWLNRCIRWMLAPISGRSAEPRAWDRLFSKSNLAGYIRLRLNDGTWKAGVWLDSYASGYGEEGDLYIAHEVAVNDEGEIVTDAETRLPELLGRGLLIRWSEVQYLDFTEITVDESAGSGNG
jgi:Family of unknown function (DUF6338)